ncbi:alpha/beta-hydrolase [Hyaloscypha variabilis]
MSCPDCYKGHIHEGNPRGRVTKLYGFDTYVTEPADDRVAKSIVVIISDIFGWEFINNRLLADHYADKGNFTVYLPDFMNGRPVPVWMIDTVRILSNPGNYFSKINNIFRAMYGFLPFLVMNRFGKSHPVVKKFFVELRKHEGANLPVGAAGFCWGGKHVVLLAADEVRVNDKPLMDAGFTGHPSQLSVPMEIERMKLPVSFAVGDKDTELSLVQCEQIKSIIEAKPEAQRGEMKIYKDCGHGFCVRADAKFVDVAKQAAEAEDQCAQWFNKYLAIK